MIAYTKIPIPTETDLIRQAILNTGEIKYVKTKNAKVCIFVLKLPASYIEPYQEVDDDTESYSAISIKGFETTISFMPRNYCYILEQTEIKSKTKKRRYKYKLLSRQINRASNEYEGVIEEKYLAPYQDAINSASPLVLDTRFKARLVTLSMKKLGYERKDKKDPGTMTVVDMLEPLDDFKSPKHWVPINDMLREIGLLKEERHRRQSNEMKVFKARVLALQRQHPKYTPIQIFRKLEDENIPTEKDDADILPDLPTYHQIRNWMKENS